MVKLVWKKRIRGEIADVACMGKKGPLIIAPVDKCCYILPKTGKGGKKLALDSKARSIAVNRTATIFSVLDCDGNACGFSRKGVKIWQHRIERARAMALGASGELLIDSGTYNLRYYHAQDDEPREIKCHCIPDSLALINEEPMQFAVAGRLGELGVISGSSGYEWEFSIGIQTGPISFDHASGTIVVPAFEDGIYLYNTGGETVGNFDLSAPVSSVRIANTRVGPLIIAFTADNSLVLLNIEGNLLWEKRLKEPVVAMHVAEGGGWMTIATANGGVLTYALKLSADHTPAFTTGQVADEESRTGALDITKGHEDGEVALTDKKTPQAHVYGEAPLKGALLPRGEGRVRVSASGHRVAASLPGGDCIVMEPDGRVVADSRIDPPARILQSSSQDFFGIWNPRKLVFINNQNNRVQSEDFESGIKQLGSSDDFQTIAFVNKKNELVVRSLQGEELTRKRFSPGPGLICVSPDGKTILVEETRLSLKFIGPDGQEKEARNFRTKIPFDHLCLTDTFCACINTKGVLLLQNTEGEFLLKEKIKGGIKNAYTLKDTLVVEENSGKCRLINEQGDTFWEFEPPPGKTLIRMPDKSDPLLFLTRKKLLTAFEGYKKKLSVLWTFKSDAEIEFIDADSAGKMLVAGAGGRLYFVGPEPE